MRPDEENKARFFLLVDLLDFFQILVRRDENK